MTRRFTPFLLLAVILTTLVTTATAQPTGRRPSRERAIDRLKQGDAAPDFTLESPDGKRTVTLSKFQGNKPVALVFGSYT